MKKGKLFERVLNRMKISIDSLLSGEVNEISLWGVSIDSVEIYLQDRYELSLDWDNYETNGWQIDWWLDTSDEKYTLSGDLASGNINICKQT